MGGATAARLALTCSMVVLGCAHGAADGVNGSFAQRVAVYRRLAASLPTCGATVVPSAEPAADGRVTMLGQLNLSVGICEEIGDAVYRNRGTVGDGAAVCRPCYPPTPGWALARSGERVDNPLDLLIAPGLLLSPPAADCDGRAFVAAMGDDRAVMVTGVLTTWQKLRSSRAIAPVSDPAPTASEAMGMYPTPVLKVKAICRLGRS